MPATFLRVAGDARRNIALHLARMSDILLLWLARHRERRRLDSMSDHLLKDMGISRADAEREVMKKFWRG